MAERASGVQQSVEFVPCHWITLDDVISNENYAIGVDAALTKSEATVWTAHFPASAFTAQFLQNPVSGFSGPLIIVKCACGASTTQYPNQHKKTCPEFISNFCHCPPATGPNQPHRDNCSHYRQPPLFAHATIGFHSDWILDEDEPVKQLAPLVGPHFGHGLPQAKLSVTQTEAYTAAIKWLNRQDVKPVKPVEPVIAAGNEIAANLVKTLDSMLPPLSIECTCGAFEDADIGHAAYCPLGDGTAPEGTSDWILE